MVHGDLFEPGGVKQSDGAEYQEAPPDVGRAYAFRDAACLVIGVSLSGFGATTNAGGMAAGCLQSWVSVSASPRALCPLKLQDASFSSLIPALTLQGHLDPATEVSSVLRL